MLCPKPRILLILWRTLLSIVIVGELLPGDSTPMELLSKTNLTDTAMHFTAYAALAFIPTVGLPLANALVCLMTTVFAGVALEFVQSLIPGRTGDAYDVLANTFGLLAGAALAIAARRQLNED